MKINQLANGSLMIATIFVAALTACGKAPPLPPPPVDENTYPVSHWLNDPDPCVRKTAAAIIKSGLPYPNIVRKDPATVTERDKRLGNDVISYDAWVGDVRLVIPAKYAAVSALPVNHPKRVTGIIGNMPDFYPAGPPGPLLKRQGSFFGAGLTCSPTLDEPKEVEQYPYYTAYPLPYSTEQGIATDKANFEKEAARLRAFDMNTKFHEESIASTQKAFQAQARENWEYHKSHPPKVTINRRDDLGMTEILLERGGEGHYHKGTASFDEGISKAIERASYWPYKELKSADGYITNFACEDAHYAQDNYVYMTPFFHCRGRAHWSKDINLHFGFDVAYLAHAIPAYKQANQALMDFIAAGKYTPVNPIPEQVNQSNKK
jgi:predicted small lipoprotein YifL